MNPSLPTTNSFDQIRNQLGNLYQRFGPQLPSHNPSLFQNLQAQPQAENVLNSAYAAGQQIKQNVGQPISQGFFNVQKPVFNTLYAPGQNVVQPALQRFGVSPQIAGVAGLATDILAPGPEGELQSARRLQRLININPEISPRKLELIDRFLTEVGTPKEGLRFEEEMLYKKLSPKEHFQVEEIADELGVNTKSLNTMVKGFMNKLTGVGQQGRDAIGRFTHKFKKK